jgi:hypothetical protein
MPFDAGLQQDVTAAIWQPYVEAEALSLVNPLFDAELLPSREQILRLLSWAPIIEHVAYRYFTHACMFVDQPIRISPVIDISLAPAGSRSSSFVVTTGARMWERRMSRLGSNSCRGDYFGSADLCSTVQRG